MHYNDYDKLKYFEKCVNDYLNESDRNDPIKQAIKINDISALENLYMSGHPVFQDHIIYAIYKKKFRIMSFIYNLVEIKYAKHDFKSEAFLLQCITHNFLVGFKFLQSKGYKMTEKSINIIFELVRYDFIEYIMCDMDYKSLNINLFNVAYFADFKNNNGYKCLSILKEYNIPAKLEIIINNKDVSGINYIRNEYDNKVDYSIDLFKKDNYSQFYNTSVLQFIYDTDVNKKIDWNYDLLLYSIKNSYYDLTEFILKNFKQIKTKFRFYIIEDAINKRFSLEIIKLLIDSFVDETNNKYFDISLIYSALHKYNFQIAKYLIERFNINTNDIVIDNYLLQKLINLDDLDGIKYILRNFNVEYNIYELQFNRCSIEIPIYLLSRFKAHESPLLNTSSANNDIISRMLISLKKVIHKLDLDEPGFRQLIYQDFTNMHPKLAKKCRIKLNHITYLYKKIFEDLKDNIPIPYDILKYEICPFI